MNMSVTMHMDKKKTIAQFEEQFAGSEWTTIVGGKNGSTEMAFLGDNGKRSKLVLTFHEDFFNVSRGITSRALIQYAGLSHVMLAGSMYKDIVILKKDKDNLSFSL